MNVKNLIGVIGVFVYFLSMIFPLNIYCSELRGMGTLSNIIVSECFINYILQTMILLGLIVVVYSTKKNMKIIVIIIAFIIILSVLFHYINIGTFRNSVGIQLDVIVQIFKSYLGSFVGIILGLIYFKQIKNPKRGLLYLVLIWLIFNIVYPFVA